MYHNRDFFFWVILISACSCKAKFNYLVYCIMSCFNVISFPSCCPPCLTFFHMCRKKIKENNVIIWLLSVLSIVPFFHLFSCIILIAVAYLFIYLSMVRNQGSGYTFSFTASTCCSILSGRTFIFCALFCLLLKLFYIFIYIDVYILII